MFGLTEKEMMIYGGAAIGGLALLLILARMLGKKGKTKHKDLEKGQHEILDDYPSPPPPGNRKLMLDGLEVRMRLVVFAPVGTQKRPITPDEAPELLDDLMRGLGSFIKSDKPRIRVWPPQLSVAGWPPTFFRLAQSPDEEDRKSNWIRVAGTIRIAGKPHLLGLALYANETNRIGTIIFEPTDWMRRLQIEKNDGTLVRDLRDN